VLNEGDRALFWPISNPTVENRITFGCKTIGTCKRQGTCCAKSSQNMMNSGIPLHAGFYILDFDRGEESNANPGSGRAFPTNIFRYVTYCHVQWPY